MKTIHFILPLLFASQMAHSATDVSCASADGKVTLTTDWVRTDGELILKLEWQRGATLFFSAHPLTLQNNLILIPQVGDVVGKQFRLTLGKLNTTHRYPRSKLDITIDPRNGTDDRMTRPGGVEQNLDCTITTDEELANVCTEKDEAVYGDWLLQASAVGDFDRAQQAISCGADLNAVNSQKCSALMLAPLVDSKDCGKSGSERIDSNRWARSEAIFKYLLDEGANTNLQDKRGESVTRKVVNTEMLSLLSALKEAGADLNKQDQYGMTPLMSAALSANNNAVKKLVALGVDLDIKNALGQTAYDLGEKLDTNSRALLKPVNSDGIVIQGSDSGCSPLKISIPMSTPTKITLKAGPKSQFTMIQRDLGIELSAAPGASATQTIKYDGMGSFKFDCGAIGGAQGKGQITITM